MGVQWFPFYCIFHHVVMNMVSFHKHNLEEQRKKHQQQRLVDFICNADTNYFCVIFFLRLIIISLHVSLGGFIFFLSYIMLPWRRFHFEKIIFKSRNFFLVWWFIWKVTQIVGDIVVDHYIFFHFQSNLFSNKLLYVSFISYHSIFLLLWFGVCFQSSVLFSIYHQDDINIPKWYTILSLSLGI